MIHKIMRGFTTLIFLLGLALALLPKAAAASCDWGHFGGCTGDLCWVRSRVSEGKTEWFCCTPGTTSPSTEGKMCVCRAGWWRKVEDESEVCVLADGGGGGGNTIFNPVIRVQGITALANYIGTFWQAAYIVAGILVLVYLLVGAIKYITSGGDEKAVASAKTMMTNAIIGLVILAASYPIIKIVEIVFGINILQITWPTV